MRLWGRRDKPNLARQKFPAQDAWERLPLVDSPLDGLRLVTAGDSLSWVLFEHGTYVLFHEPGPDVDLRVQAITIMQGHGPVHAGSPAGDFSVDRYRAVQAFLVMFDHPTMFTFVDPRAVGSSDHLQIGLHGRAKRERDAAELTVVHIEDKRPV